MYMRHSEVYPSKIRSQWSVSLKDKEARGEYIVLIEILGFVLCSLHHLNLSSDQEGMD